MSCLTCKKIFDTVTALKDHCLEKDHLCYLFTCVRCSESYKSLAELDLHMREHQSQVPAVEDSTMANDKVKKTMKCEVCGKMFQYQGGLNDHIVAKAHFTVPEQIHNDIVPERQENTTVTLPDSDDTHAVEKNEFLERKIPQQISTTSDQGNSVDASYIETRSFVDEHRPQPDMFRSGKKVQEESSLKMKTKGHAIVPVPNESHSGIVPEPHADKNTASPDSDNTPTPTLHNNPPALSKLKYPEPLRWCVVCRRTFATLVLLKQHKIEDSHFKCLICPDAFCVQRALDNHIEENHHHECDLCSEIFQSASELAMHMSASGCDQNIIQRNPVQCGICGKSFQSERGLRAHMRSDSNAHTSWNCSLCWMTFSSKENLTQHQHIRHMMPKPSTTLSNSSAIEDKHTKRPKEQPQKTFKCLVCSCIFGSPSAVAQHMESGCHKALTRHHITYAVKALKIIPQITVQMITGPIDPPAPIKVHTPNSSSWNGSAYQCSFCPTTFSSLDRLGHHLNSPTHDDKQFMCPECKKEFILISALVQHLESQTCGLTDHSEILGFYDRLMGQFSQKLLTAAA